jgi:transcriptional regulator with XRE-family HTH domain
MPESSRPPKIGKNISELRKRKGLTLEELSKQSGVSKSMLFQIEQEKVNPSVATVWKIARGLNANFLTILAGPEHQEDPMDVLRKTDASIMTSEDGKCRIRTTSNVSYYDHLETYQLDFEAGGVLASDSHFPGTEELIIVQSGKFRVVSGGNAVDLASGDSLRFPADVAHAIENRSTRRAKALLIVHHLESGIGIRRNHSLT